MHLLRPLALAHMGRLLVLQAAREVNQLRGAPRQAMADWLADARTHLEVTQALSAVRAHVAAISLSYMP